jgi:hypothetical protein
VHKVDKQGNNNLMVVVEEEEAAAQGLWRGVGVCKPLHMYTFLESSNSICIDCW